MKIQQADTTWVPDPVAIETAGVLVFVALVVCFAIMYWPAQRRRHGPWDKHR